MLHGSTGSASAAAPVDEAAHRPVAAAPREQHAPPEERTAIDEAIAGDIGNR